MTGSDLFNSDALKSIIQETLLGVLADWETARSKLRDDRIAYTEVEAAALLGIEAHVLRDARLRGEIDARKIGKKYVYARSELVKFASACGPRDRR